MLKEKGFLVMNEIKNDFSQIKLPYSDSIFSFLVKLEVMVKMAVI